MTSILSFYAMPILTLISLLQMVLLRYCTVVFLMIVFMGTFVESKFPIQYANNRPALAKVNTGVIFRALGHQFIPTDSLHHLLFTIAFPPAPVLRDLPRFTNEDCQSFPDEELVTSHASDPAFYSFMADQLIRRDPALHDTMAKVKRAGFPLWTPSHIDQAVRREQIDAKRKACAQLTNSLAAFNSRYNALRSQIHLAHQTLQDLLIAKSSPKQKRAILSFLSPLFTNLFGLADSSDLANIQANFDFLHAQHKSVRNFTALLHTKLTTIEDVTNRRIDTIWTAIERTNNMSRLIHAEFQNLTAKLPEYFKQIEREFTSVYSWLTHSNTVYDNINLILLDIVSVLHDFSLWRQAVFNLASGFLPETLVPLHDLRTALSSIDANLRTSHRKFNLIHGPDDASYYYLHSFTTSFIHQDHQGAYSLVIHVGVPLSTVHAMFNIFQTVILPVPLMSSNSSVGYTILAPKSIEAYFVVSTNDEFFTEISSSDLQYCLSLEDTTCPLLQTIRDRLVLSCGAAIYFGIPDAIERACDFLLFPNSPPPPYVEYVSRGVHLISSPEGQFDIQCPSQGRTSQIGYLTLVTLPCECALSTKTSIVPPSLANCADQSTDIKISYPANTPQQLLFDLPGFDVNEPALQVPSPSVPDDYSAFDLSALRSYDTALRIDLRSKAILTEDGPMPITSPVPISRHTEKSKLWLLSIYGATISSIVFAFVFILAVVLLVKYRLYSPLFFVMVEHYQRKVSASPVDYTVPLTNIAAAVNHSWIVDALLTFLLALINVLTFAILRRLSSARPSVSTSSCTVFMTLYDTIHTATFPLATFPACLSKCNVDPIPRASRFSVTYNAIGQSVLHVKFAEPLVVTIMHERLTVRPDVNQPIPDTIAAKIRRHQFRLSDNTDNLIVLLECICECGCQRRDLAPWMDREIESLDGHSSDSNPVPPLHEVIHHLHD